ncbi:MAG TPA: hypothetical protein VF025_14165, partial [Gaiellaceae bacterium]
TVIVDRGVLEGEPVRAVSWLEPEHEWDSGFALFRGPPDSDAETALVCLHCLIDEHPEIGRGLELAREHGEATRNGNTWSVRG